jgi:hypothetical protein
MADTSRDFWPDIETTPTFTTPLTILKEQAAALAKKTKGLLEGRVDTTTDVFDRFEHLFRIVAPTLDNYAYELFRVKHNVLLYPVEIEWSRLGNPDTMKIDSEQEFERALKQILSSTETMKVISNLLAQARA